MCVSNAQVLKRPVKIDQSEGIPDLYMATRPFVKFAHRRSFASTRALFFSFLPRLFSRSSLELTGRLQEAITHVFTN